MALTVNGKMTGRAASKDLQDRREQIENHVPGWRDEALAQIKQALGSDAFRDWFNKVYELRRAGKQAEYEKAISEKLVEVEEKKLAHLDELLGDEPIDQRVYDDAAEWPLET